MKISSNQQILVSTDSIGFLGTASQFLYLWDEYFKDGFLSGVELIGFKPVFKTKKIFEKLNKKNIKVISIHGKIGTVPKLDLIRKIFLRMIDFFILEYSQLIKNFSECEFLFHSTYLKNPQIQKEILKNPPEVLWIENSSSLQKNFNELDETLKLVDFFRKHKIKSFGMLDLYHATAFRSPEEIINDWFFIFKQLKKYLNYFSGIHLPIGPRLSDALPIELADREKIDFLKKEILSNPQRIVIENPQTYSSFIFLTDKMIKNQKDRNKKIIKKLFF